MLLRYRNERIVVTDEKIQYWDYKGRLACETPRSAPFTCRHIPWPPYHAGADVVETPPAPSSSPAAFAATTR